MVKRCKYKRSRKLKENLVKIRRSLNNIEEYEKKGKKISEIDTQNILVEPILCIAGYDIYNPNIVKRASRNTNSQEFDIEVYRRERLFLAIEVKALSSKEFNINISKNNIGALKKDNDNWKNNYEDGVGQLRAYCLNWRSKIKTDTIPILTNGKEWVIFRKSFLEEKNPLSPITKSDFEVFDIRDVHKFFCLLRIIRKI